MARTASERAALRRCRTIANLLDDAVRVPGTDRKIGIDPLVGLLPIAGDAVMAALSGYVVAEAIRLDVPRETVLQMIGNVLVDFLGGSIPVVGDLFDAAFKANVRNVQLLEEALDAPEVEAGS
jgi:hypothetical protein